VGSAGFSPETSVRYDRASPQIALEPRPLFRRARGGEVRLQLRDVLRHLADVIADALEPLLQHGLARDLVGHDLGAGVGRRVDLVAVPVVPVEVRVHDVADGLGRDLAQVLDDHARRRGLAVRVDDHHPVVGLDDRGVAVDLVGGRGHGGVHAVRQLRDVELRVALAGPLVGATVHRGGLLSDAEDGPIITRANALDASVARDGG